MSDTKTLDPKAKQSPLSDADKQQARETAARDNAAAEQEQAARQAEISDLNDRYNAPSYTPPPAQEETEPQQAQQGPNTGDTPMGSNDPEDQDQSGGKRRSAERAKKWRDRYNDHKERLGKKKAEKNAAKAAKKTEKGLQNGKKGLETGGRTAKAGGNVSRVGAAGEGAAGAGEAAGATGTAAGGAGAAGAGGAAVGGTAAGGAATGAVAGGTAAGTAAAAEGGVMAAGAASAPETLGIGLAVAAAIAATIEVVRHPKKWAMRAVYIALGLFAFVAFFIMLTGDPAAGSDSQNNQDSLENSLIITKTAPEQVNNGAKITYTVTVKALNAIGDVTVTDPLPQGTTFDSATGKVTCEGGAACTATSRTVTWKSKENNLTAPFVSTFTLTVLPSVRDAYVVNIANGTAEDSRNLDCQGDQGYVCAYKHLVAYSSIGDGWGAGRNHQGVDLIAPQETKQYALEDGVVVSVEFEGCNRPDVGAAGPGSRACTAANGTKNGQGWQSGQSTGWHVKIHDKNNRYHFYMHQVRKSNLTEGQTVHAGDVVGYTGTTGNSGTPHLHYQISYPCNDQFNCWSDPASILAKWPNY